MGFNFATQAKTIFEPTRHRGLDEGIVRIGEITRSFHVTTQTGDDSGIIEVQLWRFPRKCLTDD